MNIRGTLLKFFLFLVAGLAAFQLFSCQNRSAVNASPVVSKYYCPMHPNVVSDRPGIAVCCGMQLEPLKANDMPKGGGRKDFSGLAVMQLNPVQRQFAGVHTSPVLRAVLRRTVRATGKVVADERRVCRVNTAVDGWVRGVGDFTTGSRIGKNAKVATVYSPDFRSAQLAFLTAVNRMHQAEEGHNAPDEQRASLNLNIQMFADTLRNLGVGDPQLQELRQTRRQTDNIYVFAPCDGVVVLRNLSLGQRFSKGEELLRIADLGRVWVLADVFGAEVGQVVAGQPGTIIAQGVRMAGRVSDVPPFFDPMSKTFKVRFEVDNPGLVLRPDMLVDAEVELVGVEGLHIPVDAVLDSGTQASVFVDLGNGNFERRRTVLGARSGSRVMVLEGLAEGDLVVDRGNFLLDSESRIRGQFAEDEKAETDPVCGMKVSSQSAQDRGLRVLRDGKVSYFCSDQCKRKFERNLSGKPATEKRAL